MFVFPNFKTQKLLKKQNITKKKIQIKTLLQFEANFSSALNHWVPQSITVFDGHGSSSQTH